MIVGQDDVQQRLLSGAGRRGEQCGDAMARRNAIENRSLKSVDRNRGDRIECDGPAVGQRRQRAEVWIHGWTSR